MSPLVPASPSSSPLSHRSLPPTPSPTTDPRAAHWDRVYQTRDPTTVSWHQPHPTTSLGLIEAHAEVGGSIVDIGAGASLLVDHLLDIGHRDLTLLDISAAALALTTARLGARASALTTVVSDMLAWTPLRRFDLWHDRAVFHFLTEPADIERYQSRLLAGTHAGSTIIVAAFHLSGPTRCSALPTARYDADGLHAALGGEDRFARLEARVEQHPHPRGGTQAFQVLALRRR